MNYIHRGRSGVSVSDDSLRRLGTITAPIIGPRTVGQLDRALRALEITLDETSLAALDEIVPGPGGAGPEAGAW